MDNLPDLKRGASGGAELDVDDVGRETNDL